MSFPQVAATNSGANDVNSTSHTLNLPTGIAAGNLLIIFYAFDGSPTVSGISENGYSTLGTTSASSPYTRVAYKIATGSEGSTVTFTSDVAEKSAHITYRITGWHGTTAPAISTVATATSANPDPASLNPSGWDIEETLWLAVAAWDAGNTNLSTFPSGYTNGLLNRATSSDGVGIATAQRELAAASEDPGAFTLTGSQAWKAYTLAVRPAGATSYQSVVLADGPVGYWRLSETSGTTAQDYTANGLNGSYMNSPTLGVTGAITTDTSTNKAVTLNGTDEYVFVNDATALDVGDTFTLEAWVKTNDSNGEILSKGASSPVQHFGLYLDTAGEVRLEAGNFSVMRTTGYVVNDNQWHHIVATKSGSTKAIYIDGISRGTNDTNQNAVNNSAPLEIGRWGTSTYLAGSLDEVAIYPTALSAARVQAHYNAAVPTSDPYRTAVMADGPARYYRFEPGLQQREEITNDNFKLTLGNLPAVTTGAFTESEGGILFNGTNQYVSNADEAALDVGDTVTLQAWVKTSTSGTVQYLIDKGWATAYALAIWSDNKILFRGAATALAYSTVTVTDGVWHHVVATKSGATVKIYIDGIDRTGTVTNATLGNTTNTLHLGSTTSPAAYLNGSLDEVAIYPTALSATRVQAHYQAATGLAGPLPTAGFTHSEIGLTSTFTNTSSSATSYSWDFGDGGTSTSTNPSHTYATSGTYTVVLTATNANGVDSETQSVIVNAPPTANYTYSGTGLTRDFVDTSTDPNGTIVSRTWDFGDGTTSTATNPSKTWAAPGGTYTVTLTVFDNQGATDSEQKFFTALPPGVGNAYLSQYVFKRTIPLDGPMTLSQDTIAVEDLTYWPSEGEGMVDQEKVSWTSKDGINGPGSLTGVSRGLYGTVPVSHASGAILGLLGRHDGGISTKRQIPLMPVNASITLQELRRHEGDRFLWVDLNNFRETAQLDITGAPTESGNVSVTLDESGTAVTRSSVVESAYETVELVIDEDQDYPDSVTVTLNGVPFVIALGGMAVEKVQVILSNSVTGTTGTSKMVWYDATDTRHELPVTVAVGESAATVANRIRAMSLSGWTHSGSGATVIATASAPGTRGSTGVGTEQGWRYSQAIAGLASVHTVVTEGAPAFTAAQVAAAIRGTSFPGWTVGGTGTTVTFTYNQPGNLTGTYQYHPGFSGAASTLGMQVTNGSSMDTDSVAAAIRATYSAISGTTGWTVSGTGSRVTWTKNASGVAADATFNPQDTGTQATMQTLEQGSTDIVAYVRDTYDEIQKRRVLANIATSTIFIVETSVTGAGTARAIVNVWGSFGTDTKVLLWRVTDVDLSEYALGQLAYPVTEESSTGLTWDVITDDVKVTAMGGSETYHRDHNVLGRLIRRGVGYFRNEPEQAMQNVFVQGHRQPVIPGQEITIGAWMRWEDVPDILPAKALYVSLHHADGTATDLGALGVSGLGFGQTDDSGWVYVYGTFTVPIEENADKQAYEFRIHSRDISRGTIYFQELAYSFGLAAKRTYLYSPEGLFIVTFDTRTPRPVHYSRYGRRRIALETEYEQPDGTEVFTEYQSAITPEAFDASTLWYENPDDVGDLDIYQVRSTLDGDGLVTPEVLPGFPRVANRLLLGRTSDQPVLLKSDGTEFNGGVWFVKYEEWFLDEEAMVVRLMSGRSVRQAMHPPVGFIPKMSLGAVRPETTRYIQENWHREVYVAEVFGHALSLKLLAKPVFDRKVPPHRDSNGWQRGYWETGDLTAEIVGIRDLAIWRTP
jgi:PKD repeat protein